MTEIDRILKAKIQLQRKNPFFAHILLGIRHKRNDTIPSGTACINHTGLMQYNKEWIDSLTDANIEGVMEHEALHLVLEHLLRRRDYLKVKKAIALRLWMIAEDMVVNDILVSSGADLPEGIVPDRDHNFTLKPFDITIEDIHKKTAEFIYDEIINQLASMVQSGGGGSGEGETIAIPIPDSGDGGSGGGSGDQQDGEGQSGGGSGDTGQEDIETEEDKGSSDEEETETEEEKEDTGDKGDKEEEKLTDQEKELLDKLPKGWDEHERDESITNEQRATEIKKWRKVFIDAVEQGRNRGTLPAGIERRVQELFKEKLNWRSIMYRFVSRTIPFDFSWLRPSRKSHALGVYLPTTLREKIEVVFSIDTSGSIGDKDLDEFVSEMVGMANSFHMVDMTVIVCDADIQDTIELRNVTAKKIINEIKLKGKGGTSHLPVFQWISENKPNAKILVALTDGMTEFPDKKDVRIPTIWILGGSYREKKENFPFGKVIEIPRYES